jgi:DNA primase
MSPDAENTLSLGVAPRRSAAGRPRRLRWQSGGTKSLHTAATLAKRPGRLFIDYLRNGRGTTAAGAYSPRARAGFPIAAPVTWQHVERGGAPDAFTPDRPSPRSKAR